MPRLLTLADHTAARDADLRARFGGQVVRHDTGATSDACDDYLATLASRAASYAAHIAAMQMDPDVPAWALAMAGKHGPYVRVHHQITDWLTALLILRYGEAVEHWPVAVTAADRQRAAALLAGSRWPDALQLLPQITKD